MRKPTSATAAQMGERAAALLDALAADQRQKARFPFPAWDERTRWSYKPNDRAGLALGEMTPAQQRLTHRLVASGLSVSGYATAAMVVGLERILDAAEGWKDPARRDPGRYWISVFGEPHAKEPWGWRFEGHHLSLHYALAGGRVVAPTPTFFGANPADAPLGGSSLRPLAGVEDAARDLIHALGEEQRRVAIVAPVAPPDILTANAPRLEAGTLPAISGLAASAMTTSQKGALMDLVRLYLQRLPDDVAEHEMALVARHGIDAIHFAWAGGIERRQPHYYRLQNTRFVVEYDNTQNDANHVHTVWRDPANDFGADVLARHYADAHR
jgi:hypothetical protein